MSYIYIMAITTTSHTSNIPVGTLCGMATDINNLPPTLLPCDGREITQDEYPSLFDVLNREPKYIAKQTLLRKLLNRFGFDIPYKKVLNPKFNTKIKIPDLKGQFVKNPVEYPTLTTE